MNLEEAARRNKYTMSLTALNVAWSMGNSFNRVAGPAKITSPAVVVDMIATLRGMTVSDLMQPNRQHHISHPRQIAMMIIRDTCPNLSLPAIGRFFSLDYNTIHTGISQARRRVRQPGEMRALYFEACMRLNVEPNA